MIFKHLPVREILDNYNGVGLLCFLVPVYLKLEYVPEYDQAMVSMNEYGFPVMHERNGIPKALFFLASVFYGAWVYAGLSVGVPTRVPLMVTGVFEDDDSA